MLLSPFVGLFLVFGMFHIPLKRAKFRGGTRRSCMDWILRRLQAEALALIGFVVFILLKFA